MNLAGPDDDEGNTISRAEDIRAIFSQIGINDSKTIALVGDGRVFGECHDVDPTTGFVGPWVSTPTSWEI